MNNQINNRETNCYHCGNTWIYKGNKIDKTTCTNCSSHVYFKKSRDYRKRFGIDFFNRLSNKYVELGISIHNNPDNEEKLRNEYNTFKKQLIIKFENGTQ